MDKETVCPGGSGAEAGYEKLKRILCGYGSAAVAFSGGVDSTFLLAAAHEALGERAIAVTTTAPWFPMRESEEAREFCASRGIRHILIDLGETKEHDREDGGGEAPGDEGAARERDDREVGGSEAAGGSGAADGIAGFGIPAFSANPPDRCYHCKKALFQRMGETAAKYGIDTLVEGSNTDDDGDYRPGHRAIRELGIRSPLREAGLSKDDIRQLSRQMDLPTWDKPSFACLASRIPYGEPITGAKLAIVEQAEDYLLSLGFTQMRVRVHEAASGVLLGRIELPEEDIPRMADRALRDGIRQKLQTLGLSYVSLDLEGYHTGSLNRTLDAAVLEEGLTADADAPDLQRNAPGETAGAPDPRPDAPAEEETFSRTRMLLGKAGMRKLADARVAVFGIGGVGGYAVEGLARSGIGALDLIDHDTVSLSNLNRQIIATLDTVGEYKVDVAARRIRSINPGCHVETHRMFYLPETKDQFDFREYDYIVDAIDTVAGKLALAEAAKEAGTPIISAMGAGNKLDASAFRVADLYETSVCPLAKVMRRECRKRGIDALKVVYSREEPLRPEEHAKTGKRTPGSTAFAPSVMGLIIAGEVVKDIVADIVDEG